jgi:HK97 gp10 family phage protein
MALLRQIGEDRTNEVYAVIHADTISKLNQAGDMVRDTMKAECPVRTGALKKSIRVQRIPSKLAIKVIAGNRKAWYPHLVIYGTVKRNTYKRGELVGRGRRHIGAAKNTGVMPPNNFMLRAMNKNAAALKTLFGKPITIVGDK